MRLGVVVPPSRPWSESREAWRSLDDWVLDVGPEAARLERELYATSVPMLLLAGADGFTYWSRPGWLAKGDPKALAALQSAVTRLLSEPER